LSGGEPHWQQFKDRFPDRVGYHGINSGVFALRPEYWLDLPERFEAAIEGFEWTPARQFSDQPFISAIFLQHVKPLPFSYNAYFSFEIPIPRAVHNVHFTGIKPWNPAFPKHERAWGYWLRYGAEPSPGLLDRALAACLIMINRPRCAWSRRKHRSEITARIVTGNPQYQNRHVERRG